MISISEYMDRLDPMIGLLQRLVEIESPSKDKAAVDRVGAEVRRELEQMDANIEVEPQDDAGDHIIARWNGEQDTGSILLLCHMDTVFPIGTLNQNPFRRQEGVLTGPGVLDMKAGIAILLSSLKALKETGHWPRRPIIALFTSDEETGSRTSRPVIERFAQQASLVLCLEPSMPDGALKTWRKGVGGFEVVVHGRAAHAGASHQDGRNAIAELAHQVLMIEQFTDYERGTTLNVGVIEGGTASNVVPEWARARVDMRVMSQTEADRVIHFMGQLSPVLDGTSIEVTGGLNRPPMPHDQLMAATFNKAQAIGARLGLHLLEGGSGGGSDANFVAPFGVPVLDGLGAQGNGMHSDREYVLISSLPERAALLSALLTEW